MNFKNCCSNYFLIFTLVIVFLILISIRILLLKSHKFNKENFAQSSVYRAQVAPVNMLTSEEIQDRDSDIIRNVRFQDAPPPSLQAELDYYQMTSILEKIKTMKIPLLTTIDDVLDKEIQDEKQSVSNITTKNWWMAIILNFTAVLNKAILDSKYYQPYHPYNLLTMKKTKILHFDWSKKNIVFEGNFDRDGYQNFNIQLDINLVRGIDGIWKIEFNALEIVGIPRQKNSLDVYSNSDPSQKIKKIENYRKFNMKELNDSDPKYFNFNYQADKVQEKRYEIAKDALYQASKCFGLLDGKSEILNYDNKLFCESYHADIDQVGVWDSPCQIDTDCPFYQANKNYPNTFGGCDKISGKCQMPNGIIPLGYKKYGKTSGLKGEPLCYNCEGEDDRCCHKQARKVVEQKVNIDINNKNNKTKLLSPDFVFQDDMKTRKMHSEELDKRGLKAEASLI
jgi:hypothetical protein